MARFPIHKLVPRSKHLFQHESEYPDTCIKYWENDHFIGKGNEKS